MDTSDESDESDDDVTAAASLLLWRCAAYAAVLPKPPRRHSAWISSYLGLQQ